MSVLENVLRVLVVGLVLGAGLPAVFALGLRAFAHGTGGATADGTTDAPNPLLKAVGVATFALVGMVIVVAILWITRATIDHHFGIDLFPFLPKK
ncbi:hypothetical protein LV457_08665 [Mycobacterium sp. MYCO198283]|uniref:hypothetical protein n=1 Tax=Mycobacterium sp. MYCO198283 TaxID=2883505 RepID=UPI001E5E35CA|nr:hypothetical protein [Mycobacterium sp. MYCO198283]MCG5432365.1 hypothetical protein [Mycobacterium sp. MYCO198283]